MPTKETPDLRQKASEAAQKIGNNIDVVGNSPARFLNSSSHAGGDSFAVDVAELSDETISRLLDEAEKRLKEASSKSVSRSAASDSRNAPKTK